MNESTLIPCPKCGHEQTESLSECMKCGVIFSKVFEKEADKDALIEHYQRLSNEEIERLITLGVNKSNPEFLDFLKEEIERRHLPEELSGAIESQKNRLSERQKKLFFYRAYRILLWLNLIIMGLFCVPTLLLFIINLIDGIPDRLETFYSLMGPFVMLSMFLGILFILKKNAKRSNFSKIDFVLIFPLIILLAVSIRIILIVFNPIGLWSGGRQISLPIENHWATAHGGPSVKFFGGIRKSMSLSVLDGHRVLWEFDMEVYPHTLSWRESTLKFDETNNRVTFAQGSGEFGSLGLVTPNIWDASGIKRFENQSKKISTSPNGRFSASVQSDKNKMVFMIMDTDHNVLWKCDMIHCSATIDWKHGHIVWHACSVVFDYESTGGSYFHKFSLRTPSFFGYNEERSFLD